MSLPPTLRTSLLLLILLSTLVCGGDPMIDAEGRYVVTSSEDDGPGSLRVVLQEAPSNSEITFAENVQTIELAEGIELERDVRIINERDEKVEIITSGEEIFFFHDLVESAHLEGLSFSGSSATAVSGLIDLTVIDCHFIGNGSIENEAASALNIHGSLHVESSLFGENTNTNIELHGGATLVIKSVEFESPTEETGDEERFFLRVPDEITSDVTIMDSTFDGDDLAIGGIFYEGRANLTILNTTFRRLRLAAGPRGGAVLASAIRDGQIYIVESRFQENGNLQRPGPNGALSVTLDGGAALTIEATHFQDNEALGQGAAINVETSDQGDHIRIFNSHFTGHTTEGTLGSGGGAVYGALRTGTLLEIDQSAFTDNSSSEAGGALQITSLGNLFTSTTIDIKDSIFESNTAAADAGAIRASFNDDSRLTIERSLFRNNQAAQRGSALSISGGQLLSVHNSTFTENTTSFAAVLYSSALSTELAFTTISGNEGEQGGALLLPEPEVFGYSPSLDLRGSLLAGNTPVDVANFYETDDALQVTAEFNIIGELDPGLTLIEDGMSGNIISTDAQILETPEDHGGFSHTITYSSDHPGYSAIDAADCTDASGDAITEDQRGSLRPIDGTCSAGAWERNP